MKNRSAVAGLFGRIFTPHKVAFFVFVGCLFGVGCSEEPAANGEAFPLRIAATISSRVSGLNFETGDAIGLTVEKGGASYLENARLTYDGSTFTAAALLWYNNLHETSTLQAYYPYSAAGCEEFNIATDQSAELESSDLLGAKVEGVTPSTSAVKMTFHHLLSQLVITVDNRSDGAISQITLDGTVPTATVDLTIPAATAKSGAAPATITPYTTRADGSYSAILVPQTAALTVTIATTDGKSRSKTLKSATLEGGRSYDLSVVVTNIDIALTLSGEISDWTPGGSLEEDNTTGSTDNDTTSGPAPLTYAGESYATQEIAGRTWMAENLRYHPADATLGAGVWNPAGGASAVATQGLHYDYATATSGTASAAATTIQGICPAGWHLPDREELESLAANLPADFLCQTGYWRETATTEGQYDETKSLLLGATVPEEGKCDALVFTTPAAATLTTIRQTFGASVRCVKD